MVKHTALPPQETPGNPHLFFDACRALPHPLADHVIASACRIPCSVPINREEPLPGAVKVHYNSGMAIRFTDSAYRHFGEDRLDEAMVLRAIGEPVWTAIVDPDDPSVPPPAPGDPPTALIVCKRHPGALDDDLLEVLIHPDGPDMRVFHVMHLGGLWRDYWHRWSDGRDGNRTTTERKRQ